MQHHSFVAGFDTVASSGLCLYRNWWIYIADGVWEYDFLSIEFSSRAACAKRISQQLSRGTSKAELNNGTRIACSQLQALRRKLQAFGRLGAKPSFRNLQKVTNSASCGLFQPRLCGLSDGIVALVAGSSNNWQSLPEMTASPRALK